MINQVFFTTIGNRTENFVSRKVSVILFFLARQKFLRYVKILKRKTLFIYFQTITIYQTSSKIGSNIEILANCKWRQETDFDIMHYSL